MCEFLYFNYVFAELYVYFFRFIGNIAMITELLFKKFSCKFEFYFYSHQPGQSVY